MFGVGLAEYSQQTDHLTKEGYPLDEGCGQDHCTANVAGSLGLTGDRLNGRSSQTTDTHTGTDGSQTCADTSAHYTNSFHEKQSLYMKRKVSSKLRIEG